MLLATHENRTTNTVVSLEFCVSILMQVRLHRASLHTVIKRRENNYRDEKKTLLLLFSEL